MIGNARRVALGIILRKKYFYFGVQKRLRAVLNPIFMRGSSSPKTKNRRRFPFGGLSYDRRIKNDLC